MRALNLIDDYRRLYGVTYLPTLRDGDDFSGRARRVARRLGLEQDRRDQELITAHGGRAAVERRLFERWRDPTQSLLNLTSAEERLMLMIAIDTARTAPTSVRFVDEHVGHGVFAESLIRPGEVIGEYTGVLRKSTPEDFGNHYLAQTPAYGRFGGFIIDGRNEGNITRFINHSHAAPNVSNQHVFHAKRWHRVLRADRLIRPGEQILWDYGEDYWRQRAAPAEL